MITPSFSLTATERVLPKLALDFTTAALDPRITFTRSGATATRTNSSGFIEDVAADTARFDYNSVTLLCKGLLIEEQRSNFALQSENFANASWIKSAVTGATSSSVSPRGTLTAYTMTEDTATNNHHLFQTISTSLSTAYTMSAYIKNIDRRYVILAFYSIVTPSLYAAASFDLQTGLLVNTSAVGAGFSVTGTRISREKNDWYRIEVSVTNGSASAATRFSIVASTNGTIGSYGQQNYAGTGKSLDVFGAQLEAGAFATSYIPTTTTALTRNADVATMTGTNFSDWFNASEGAFEVTGSRFSQSTFAPFISVNDNTVTNEIYVLQVSDSGRGYSSILGSVTSAGTWPTNATGNMTFAYKVNSFAGSYNGNTPGTASSATIPSVNRMRIGVRGNGNNQMSGHIQKIMYWPQRLTTAEVQAFSK